MMNEEWRVIKEFPNYEISNLKVVRNITTGKLCKVDRNLSVGDGRVFLYNIPEGGKRKGCGGKKYTRSISTLMRENWNYEWIKELDDDEECKECWGCKGWFITTKGRIYSTHYGRFIPPTKSHSYYWDINYKRKKYQFTHWLGEPFSLNTRKVYSFSTKMKNFHFHR